MQAPTVDEHAWEAMLDEPEVGLTWVSLAHPGPDLGPSARHDRQCQRAEGLGTGPGIGTSDHRHRPRACSGGRSPRDRRLSRIAVRRQRVWLEDGCSFLERTTAFHPRPGPGECRDADATRKKRQSLLRDRLSHAFWRTCGGLVHRPGVVLRRLRSCWIIWLPSRCRYLQVMREHHRGMMTAAPRRLLFGRDAGGSAE